MSTAGSILQMKSHLGLFISLPKTAQLASACLLTVTADVSFKATYIICVGLSVTLRRPFCTSVSNLKRVYVDIEKDIFKMNAILSH